MKKWISLFILASAAVLSLSALPDFRLPAAVKQGDTFTVLIAAGPEEGPFQVSLVINGRKLSRTLSFPLPGGEEAGQAAVLGLSSEQVPGRASIRISRKGQEIYRESSFQIVSRSFETMEIALNGRNSSILQSRDPKKAEEWRLLWDILTRVDPQGVYHTGPLRVPLDDYVETAHYGDRRRYLYEDGSASTSVHNGFDLYAPAGTPVRAAGAGRVVLSRKRIISGETVVVEHLPGVYSLYYHLQERFCGEGDLVESGELLGTLGETGLATGPHLHWEIRAAGIPVEPLSLIALPLLDKDVVLGKIE